MEIGPVDENGEPLFWIENHLTKCSFACDNVAEVSYTARSGSSGDRIEDSDDPNRHRRESGKRSIWLTARHALRRTSRVAVGAHHNPKTLRMVSYRADPSLGPALLHQCGRVVGD